MSAYTDELRATALAPCDHSPDERCEHKDAALAYQLIDQGPGVGFDWGALVGWCVLGLAFNLLLILAGINVWRAMWAVFG